MLDDIKNKLRVEIYNRYYNDEITVNQKEILLEKVENINDINFINKIKNKYNKMEVEYSIHNATSSDLDKFYKNCDFAIFKNKKFNENDAKKLSKKISRIDGFNESVPSINFFIVDGKTMNKKYDLHAAKYEDNQILVIFPLNLFKTNNGIITAKQMTNSRYFNDIVDNNEYKEVQAGHHKMSKQVEHLDKYFKSLK